ncbi:MAG: hypothetical protein B7Z37_03155 [Verrucomicrobia bacterium 12-59-8]|nr:MAG: hypothetical protein B7Z37_03155 [Verrucomicrobia bacterium 12-59-8]
MSLGSKIVRAALAPGDVKKWNRSGKSLKQYVLDHPNKSTAEIADDLDMHDVSVAKTKSFYRKQGIDLPYGKRGRPDTTRSKVVPLLEEGLSTEQILKRTGISASQLYKLRSQWKAKKGK